MKCLFADQFSKYISRNVFHSNQDVVGNRGNSVDEGTKDETDAAAEERRRLRQERMDLIKKLNAERSTPKPKLKRKPKPKPATKSNPEPTPEPEREPGPQTQPPLKTTLPPMVVEPEPENPAPVPLPPNPVAPPQPEIQEVPDLLTPDQLSAYAQEVFLDMPTAGSAPSGKNFYKTSRWYRDSQANKIRTHLDISFRALSDSDIRYPEQLVPFFLANFDQEMSFGADGRKRVSQTFLNGREILAGRAFLATQRRSSGSDEMLSPAEAVELDGYLAELSSVSTEEGLYNWNQKITRFFIRQRQEHGDEALLAQLEHHSQNRIFGGRISAILNQPFMRGEDAKTTLNNFQRYISRLANTFGRSQKNVDILMQAMRADGFLDREIQRLTRERPDLFPEDTEQDPYRSHLGPEDYMRDILVRSLLELPGAPYSPYEIQSIVFKYHYKPIVDRFADENGIVRPENMDYLSAEINAGDFSVRNSAIQARLNHLCANVTGFMPLALDGDLTAYDGVVPKYYPQSNTVRALMIVVEHNKDFILPLGGWRNSEEVVASFVELSKSDALEQHPLYEALMVPGVARRMIPGIGIDNDIVGIHGRAISRYCQEMQEKMWYRYGYNGRIRPPEQIRAEIEQFQRRTRR